jgi:hypothetical protein
VNDLDAISCPAAGICVAVGTAVDTGGHARPMILRTLNGRVAAGTQQVPDVYGVAELTGVSCWSVTGCIAVGFVAGLGTQRALALRTTDGETWTAMNLGPQVPVSPNHHTRLDAVSCSAPDACTAVGVFAEGLGNPTKGYYAALVMRTHNGSDWYRMLSPLVVSSWAKGVSCTTTDLCVVVGSLYPRAGGERPLIFKKTGPLIYDWARVPVPGSNTRGLTDVSCVTSEQCTAVGRRGEGALVLATADGTTWTPQTSHAPLGTRLASVSCRGLTCTAAGVRPRPLPTGGSVAAAFAQPGLGDGAAIIRTTDGSNWSSLTVSQRDPATPASVSCPASGPCLAAGARVGQIPPIYRALLLREVA